MLRPSRDWRESMTLSSRDPHFGQRIVSEHSLSHNRLWSQCIRIAVFPVPFSLEGTRADALQTFWAARVNLAYSTTPSRAEELRCGSFRRRDFLFRLRLLLFELEADFSILQLQISGEGTSLS